MNPEAVDAPARVRRVVAGFDGLLGRAVSMRAIALLSVPARPCSLICNRSTGGPRSVTPARVVVLGGGSGGVRTALQLERLVTGARRSNVSLVNRENYLFFRPKLADVIAWDVGTLTGSARCGSCLSALRLFVREIEGVGLDRRVLTLAAGLTPRPHSCRMV